MKPMTIGGVAEQAGVSPDTIRYYQRIGLIEDVERLESGYRVFTGETVRTLRFIKRAQELGFSLEEIRELLAFRGKGTRCRDVRSAAARKVEVVDRKIVADERRFVSLYLLRLQVFDYFGDDHPWDA